MDPSRGRVRVKFKLRTNRRVKLGPLFQTFQPTSFLESVPMDSTPSGYIRPSSPCGSTVSFVSCHDDLDSVPGNAAASSIPAVICTSVPPGFQARPAPVETPYLPSPSSDIENSHSDHINGMGFSDHPTFAIPAVSPSSVAAHTRQRKKLAN